MAKNPSRDKSPDYLLGEFDADRMLRLEGVPVSTAQALTSAYVRLQEEFPTALRNVSYVTLEAGLQSADLADVSNGPLQPTLLNAARFASRREVAAVASELRRSVKNLPDGSPLRGAEFRMDVAFLAHLEHGHALHRELKEVLGMEATRALTTAIRTVIPGYSIGTHATHSDKLIAAGARTYGVRSYEKLVADSFAAGTSGLHEGPLSQAVVGAFKGLLSERDASHSLAYAQDAVADLSRRAKRVTRVPEIVEGESDQRFADLAAVMWVGERKAVGRGAIFHAAELATEHPGSPEWWAEPVVASATFDFKTSVAIANGPQLRM